MRKMRFQNILLGITSALAIFILIYVISPRALIYIFAKNNGLNVSYKTLDRRGFREFRFGELKIINAAGLGVYSESAVVLPEIRAEAAGRTNVLFTLNNVRFLHDAKKDNVSHDDLIQTLAMPFSGDRIYEEISARIELSNDRVYIKDLAASAGDIRLEIAGTIYRDGKVDGNVRIFFSNNVVAALPEELTNTILAQEKDGWRSLEVNVSGDYIRPSVQISGNMFRLKIKEVPVQ